MIKNSRIKALIDLVSRDSKLLFDLCCDKGIIGRSYQKENPDKQVLFLDIAQIGLDELHIRYGVPKKQIIWADFLNYNFTNTIANLKTTLLIAGIGAHLIIKFLEQNDSYRGAQLILSPNSHHQVLEEFLQNHTNLSSFNKSTCEFKKRTYPIYVLDTTK